MLACLTLFLISCKTQNVTLDDTMLYNQALKCLNNKDFKITILEVYDKTKNNAVEYPLESYVSVNGNESVIRFSRDLAISSSLGSSFIEDKSSQLLNKKLNKKGDTLFDLKIDGGSTWLNYILQITLYKNSNKCFVQVKNMWAKEVATFKGIFEGCHSGGEKNK